MKNKFRALMIGIFIFGSLLIGAGITLKLIGVPFYPSVLISGFAFDVLGIIVYFAAVKDK